MSYDDYEGPLAERELAAAKPWLFEGDPSMSYTVTLNREKTTPGTVVFKADDRLEPVNTVYIRKGSKIGDKRVEDVQSISLTVTAND